MKKFLLALWLSVPLLAWSQTSSELFKEALSLQESSRYKEAADVYQKFLIRDSGNALAWNNLGLCQQKLNKYSVAEESFQKAIKMAPEDAQAYNNLAGLKLQQDDFKAAEKLYLDAISKDPDYPFTYNNLASLYRKQGKIFKAIEKYKQAIDRAPTAEIYYNLGLLYFQMKKYDDMLETFQKALQMQPRFAEVYYSLSIAHAYNLLGYKKDRRELAFKQAFNKLAELNPELAQSFKVNYLNKLK